MTTLTRLIDIDDLDRDGAIALLDRAETLRPVALGRHAPLARLAGKTVVNLFFENSTRTRTSFTLAARRLGAEVIDFHAHSSSTAKGESLLDTWRTLHAMGCDGYVVRHADDCALADLARQTGPGIVFVNAGSGARAHPTQALLDALTMRQHRGDWAQLCVLIVGDVRHSRVARSNLKLLRLLGVGELRIAAPAALQSGEPGDDGIRVYDDLDAALPGCDVVMMLRLQKERMQRAQIPDPKHYFRDWGLGPERLARARPDAIVMHPGPMNREIEIASSVADGKQSVILDQVSNGVAVRMAVLETLLSGSAPLT